MDIRTAAEVLDSFSIRWADDALSTFGKYSEEDSARVEPYIGIICKYARNTEKFIQQCKCIAILRNVAVDAKERMKDNWQRELVGTWSSMLGTTTRSITNNYLNLLADVVCTSSFTRIDLDVNQFVWKLLLDNLSLICDVQDVRTILTKCYATKYRVDTQREESSLLDLIDRFKNSTAPFYIDVMFCALQLITTSPGRYNARRKVTLAMHLLNASDTRLQNIGLMMFFYLPQHEKNVFGFPAVLKAFPHLKESAIDHALEFLQQSSDLSAFAPDVLDWTHALYNVTKKSTLNRFEQLLQKCLKQCHIDRTNEQIGIVFAGDALRIPLTHCVFAVRGYSTTFLSSIDPFRHTTFDINNIYQCRIWYYTGIETTRSLKGLRQAVARLHLQATRGRSTFYKRHNRWNTFCMCVDILPIELQLSVCCVQTLCPALPMLSDFGLISTIEYVD